MSRGYGKYRRGGGSHASFQFENLFKENSNRPSAARSAATVGKWGITSFTSIRTVNGVARYEDTKSPASGATPVAKEGDVPKPKKFFKSRDPPETSPATYSTAKTERSYGGAAAKKQRNNSYSSSSPEREREVVEKRPRKFFSSKNNNCGGGDGGTEKTVFGSNVNNVKKGETKPPIVLRICRGKSQLVSDSEESESTPTPSSTPSTSTSPRALRDHPKSPGPVRITRSTRRSMQQDPNSSPATADTPSEFSLFSSPKKDIDLSPQYIPAEKYELERKAMYDNLLGSISPKTDEEAIGGGNIIDEVGLENKNDEQVLLNNAEAMKNEEGDEDDDSKKLQECADLLLAETNVDLDGALKTLQEEPVKRKMEDDWSTDSDSNSTGADKTAEQHTATSVEHREEEEEKPQQESAPPVKLIISKKKGSIFKSRSMVSDGGKKRLALYKHKWCDDKDSAKSGESVEASKPDASSSYDFDFKDDPLVRVTRSSVQKGDEEAVTGVKCTRNDKGFYTVVRNVKKAHQIQEIGEFQEFNDDVDYILDALQDNNPISTRCLSAITLASKCMVPAFRMHVRAHGTVGKFFKALHDATKDQSLGLCTATVMFVLSQDRLNMDLDRDCLELMLNLLESDVSYQQALDVCGLSSAQLEKNKQKVRELCAEIQSQGHAMHLNLDNITVGQLAMETLLSLTSKRAGEWFKEELRELGGLDHIMKTICECCRQVSDYVVTWTDTLLDKLRKVDRCMRVLENVTHNNEENQIYLLRYNNGEIVETLVKLYRLCDAEIPLYPVTDVGDKDSTGTVIREALLVTLKVLINLTHHFNKQSMGSSLVGSRPGIIDASLHLLLQVPHYIPDQKKFELGVLVLMLLINLIQDNEENKRLLINAKAPAEFESRLPCDKSAVEALIVQFYQWEEYARLAEKRTNAILDGEKDTEGGTPGYKSNEEFIEETVAKLLQKAGTHMEFTFLASYTVILLGYLIIDNQEYLLTVRHFLKRQLFTDMVEILKKFFNFMSLTASTEASSVCAIKATEKVIKFLEECDTPPPETQLTAAAATTQVSSYSSECMDLSFSVAH